MTSQPVAPLQVPALISVSIALLAFLLQVFYSRVVGHPSVGQTASENPGVALGLLLLGLLTFGRLALVIAPLLGLAGYRNPARPRPHEQVSSP